MKKFEYKTVKIREDAKIFHSEYDLKEMERMLNQLGSEGWELVSNIVQTDIMGSATGAVLVFKREV
ncbi:MULTISPECIES: DUF4177 domain-containing protein [Chitinophagaceae]